MFSRRGILGLFGGLFSWFVAKKVVAEPIVELQTLDHVLPEGFIPLPDWCPEGFVPMLGQNIAREQFPALFEPAEFVRKNGSKGRYLPPFHGLEIAPLPNSQPTIPTELQAHGYIDRLTRVSRRHADTKIVVHVMAAKPQVTSNGRVCQAGFSAALAVEREKFEAFYGPIEGPSKIGMFYNGYEVLELYQT